LIYLKKAARQAKREDIMLGEAIELLEDAEEIVSNEANQDHWNEAQLLAIADQIRQCKNELSALLEESASLRMSRTREKRNLKEKERRKVAEYVTRDSTFPGCFSRRRPT